MMTGNDDRFDDIFRSSLADAIEEVPAHVWDSIEKRLPAKNTTKVIPLMFKVLIPAAAAAILAVFVAPWLRDDTPSYDATAKIDVIRTSTVLQADIPAPQPLTDATLYPTSASQAMVSQDSGTIDNSGTIDDSGTIVPAEEIIVPSSETIVPENNQVVGDVVSAGVGDQWEEFPGESEEAGSGLDPKFAVTLSGNAISNTGSSSGSKTAAAGTGFRPLRASAMKDRVAENSVSSYGIPLTFGIGAKIDFTPRWALSAGFSYSGLSRTFDGTYYKWVDNQYKGNVFSNIKNRQHYIGIPVNAYYNILKGDFINFYVYAGGAVEKCIADRYLMTDHDRRYIHTEKVSGVQWSANAGIGLEFLIAGQFGLYIDPSLRYYFPNGNQPKSIRTVQPLMFGLEMGFRVHL